ncbi:MAG: SDR family oxidoreductase [Hyphomicrobium sp.]
MTGASSGIGRATAEYFAARDWSVAATMRTPESADSGGVCDNIRLFKLDVTDLDSIATAVSDVMAAYGRIDVLVNNAGYGLIGLFEAMSPEEIARNLETNVVGMMNVTRAALPHMRQARSGRIINIGSVAGRLTLPLYSVYCATKYAVEGFSEGLGHELAPHGIGIAIIEPGAIKSEFFGRSLVRPTRPGLDAYGDWDARVFENIKAKCIDPPDAALVAKAVYTAANAKWGWRLRYKPNGWLLIAGRQLLPGEIHNRIVRFLLGAR